MKLHPAFKTRVLLVFVSFNIFFHNANGLKCLVIFGFNLFTVLVFYVKYRLYNSDNNKQYKFEKVSPPHSS